MAAAESNLSQNSNHESNSSQVKETWNNIKYNSIIYYITELEPKYLETFYETVKGSKPYSSNIQTLWHMNKFCLTSKTSNYTAYGYSEWEPISNFCSKKFMVLRIYILPKYSLTIYYTKGKFLIVICTLK